MLNCSTHTHTHEKLTCLQRGVGGNCDIIFALSGVATLNVYMVRKGGGGRERDASRSVVEGVAGVISRALEADRIRY